MEPAKRVIVCDDASPMRLLLRTEIGFCPELELVGEAINGREAVELASRMKPDIIVLDIHMPIMDGLDALPQILQASPGSKVIVLSDYEDDQIEDTVAALGAVHYLHKDSSLLTIGERVQECARE
jgi:DNA-binding NarL/FixJ family response regulator